MALSVHAVRLPYGVLIAGLVIVLAGCGVRRSDRPTDRRLPVFTGIPPLAYLTEQIGGEHVKVDALVQPGQDPHTFEPGPQQVLALGRAAIFFEVDMPFERVLLAKVRESNPRLTVVDATQGITKRMMDAPCCEGAANHDHHADGGEPDPHVWLSPPLLKIQAQNIAAALCKADPTHASDYQQNLAALLGRLDALHRCVEKMLAPHRGQVFYVFHPGFGYFADTYGLHEEPIESGGRSPTLKQLHALVEKAQADGIKAIFVQPQYAPQAAEAVADAIGGKLVPINGLGKNVVDDIEDIAMKVEAALKESTPPRHGER